MNSRISSPRRSRATLPAGLVVSRDGGGSLCCLLVVLLALVGLPGCMPRGEIAFRAAEGMHFSLQDSGQVGIRFLAEARNQNPKPLLVNEVHLDIWHRNNHLGYLYAPAPIVLPPHFADTLTVRLTMQFDTMGKLYGLLFLGRNLDPGDFEVAGYLRGRYGVLSRRILVPRRPLEEALSGIQQGLP